MAVLLVVSSGNALRAQQVESPQAMRARTAVEEPVAAARRAKAFARSHQTAKGDSPAAALVSAKVQQAGLVQAQATSLATPWTAVGPVQVQSLSYGLVTGRVTSLALDPNDASNNTLCTITPQYRDLSATGTVTVTLLTGTTANDITGKPLLFLLLPLPLWMMRRRAMRGVALALVAIAVLASAQGCGSGKKTAADGSSGGSGGSGATPSGSYTITVSATAAGVTHAVPLTLKVQ
ncbi:hypothetical protein [Terriglobus roseus]|uniref:Uncharacterized protein n=1 Tax=Terriglobus roseus TaxID=392734 RepID=A0A1G7NLP4_9BACT|nr:hypothetical protein [Terriglobus roseus]SDF75004.1 hypothetical protein SAMN05444167_3192 [Terriglobus roseus]